MAVRDQFDKMLAAARVAWSLMTATRLFGELEHELDGQTRPFQHRDLVSRYYDQCTDVYRIGWGDQFHFAPFEGDESFSEAALAMEKRLADSLGSGANARWIDIGCGIGGPARNIAEMTGAQITGINICASQIKVARQLAKRHGLVEQLHFVEADALQLPFEDGTFEAAYSIEAICHVPDKNQVYAECARVLKPAAVFAGWDWVWTRPPHDDEERRLQRVLCQKHCMSHLLSVEELEQGLESNGFEISSVIDYADPHAPRAWWDHLERKLKAPAFAGRSWIGDLIEGADSLIKLGKSGLFSPLLFWVAIKR